MLRVEIRWIDSGAYYLDEKHRWQTPQQIMTNGRLAEVSTVGWLLGEDEDTYYVGLSRIVDKDALVYGTQLIYKPNVIGITRLRARAATRLEDLDATEEDDEAGEVTGPNWNSPS